MANSILPLRRSILSKSRSFLQFLQIQSQTQNPIPCLPHFLSKQPSIQPQTRSFGTTVNSMRNSAFDNKLSRLLRNEVQLVLDEFSLDKPPSDFKGFKVAERPGERRITLTKKFGEREEINIDVTMFDGAIPIPTGGNEPSDGVELEEDEHLHITMLITIVKEEFNQVFEVICSAWPDTLDIQKLFVSQPLKMLHKLRYTGPTFKELDDELQDSMYTFLEERGIDDDLCEFVHSYIDYKEKAEYIRWMESARKAIENK